MARLVLATCQFHVHKQPERNLRSAVNQIETAKAGGAHLVHFSEACLSGYLGVEVDSHDRGDWDRIAEAMEEVMAAARRQRVWVVVGCNHRLSGRHRPHNSLYVIDDRGRLVTRYDKMFCTGGSAKEGDLARYSPGEALVTFRIRGLTCGLLICHDFRYPELFRE
ncbi:MAG: carbon-nitrogen hydrolase family protein, partial [Gemmatimonadetes bacterium]|nr:carbon-nitrogen hydrolase family protein [Gemmatimonadota bacterium]